MGVFDPPNPRDFDPATGDNEKFHDEYWKSAGAALQYGSGAPGSKDPSQPTQPRTMNAAWMGNAPTMDAATLGANATMGPTTIDQTQGNESRAYQMGLMGQLQAQAKGLGPSLGGQQLAAAADATRVNQMSAAASQQGMGNAGAMTGRQLAMGNAAGQQQLAQQSELARMQEMQAAQGQLAQLSSGIRAQDLGIAGQQASFNQQNDFANMAAQNQFGLARAGFGQQANAANQGLAGAYALQQGQFGQEANSRNQGSAIGFGNQADNLAQWGIDRWTNASSDNWDRENEIQHAAWARDQAEEGAQRQRDAATVKAIGSAFTFGLGG